MKILNLLFCVLVFSCAQVTGEMEKTEKEPLLEAAEKAIKSEVEKYDPNITLSFEYPSTSKTLVVKYKTRMFMVHSGSKIGRYSEKAEEQEGPGYQGFLLKIHVQDAGTVNQAVVPQTIREPYWWMYLDITIIDKADKQFNWALSYGARTDQELLSIVKKAIGSLDRPYLKDVQKE